MDIIVSIRKMFCLIQQTFFIFFKISLLKGTVVSKRQHNKVFSSGIQFLGLGLHAR